MVLRTENPTNLGETAAIGLLGPRPNYSHQQYLAKNPFGYRCHANTGVAFPETA
jgi:hypothetical protein